MHGELCRGRAGGWEGPGEHPLTNQGWWGFGEGFPGEGTIQLGLKDGLGWGRGEVHAPGRREGTCLGPEVGECTSPEWAFPPKEPFLLAVLVSWCWSQSPSSPSPCPRDTPRMGLLWRSMSRPPAEREAAGSRWEMPRPHPCARCHQGGGGGQEGMAPGQGRPARRSPGLEHYPPSTAGANSV